MKRVLFLTNRNVLTTSGELRLIKNRAEALYNNYEVVTDFFVLSSKSRIESPAREIIQAGGSMVAVPLSSVNLLSFFFKCGRVKELLASMWQSNVYDAVVLSGPGMGYYASFFKKKGYKVFFDIHGAVEDALVLKRGVTFGLAKIKYLIAYAIEEYNLRHNLRYADGCFVVTEPLEHYVRRKYQLADDVSFFIVPCATRDDGSVVASATNLRVKYRHKYGIGVDAKVFVYSGGVSPWQCVKETIELFKNIADQIDGEVKMVFFSHNVALVKKMIGDDLRFVVDSLRPEELREALCVADYAFMLRADCVTNNVAFPNKFLEYVEHSLKIITTPFVYEVCSQVKRFSLGVIIKDLSDFRSVINFMAVDRSYSEEISREVLRYNSFKSRLVSFVYGLS